MTVKLQLIAPDGIISWHDLDPRKIFHVLGGDDEKNQVNVSVPFHLIIQFSEKSKQVQIEVVDAKTWLKNGAKLYDTEFTLLYGEYLDVTQGDRTYTLILQDEIGEVAPQVTLPPLAGKTPTSDTPVPLPSFPPVSVIPGIVEEFSVKEGHFKAELASSPYMSTEVGSTTTYKVEVTNTSKQTSTFKVFVTGKNPKDIAGWKIVFLPTEVSLLPGEKGAVAVTLIPPRTPASYAGPHPLIFTVTSDIFRTEQVLLEGTLDIKPYYEFTAIKKLNPSRHVFRWGEKEKTAALTIVNKGNSSAVYQLQSGDEESNVITRFPVPGGPSKGTSKGEPRKAEYQETVDLEIESGTDLGGKSKTLEFQVSSGARIPWVATRNTDFRYSVTVTSKELLLQKDPNAVQHMKGNVSLQPWLSPVVLWAILGMCFFFFIGWGLWQIFIVQVGQPRIEKFAAENPVIRLGETDKLVWEVPSFIPANLKIDGVAEPVEGSRGQVSITPNSGLNTYTLMASNWLSGLIQKEYTRIATVLAIPLYPEIVTLTVDKNQIFEGETITVKWSANAEEATLAVEGVTTKLTGDKLNGEQEFTIKGDTLVVLTAKNNSGTVTRSEFIDTKPVRLEIVKFDTFPESPAEVIKGNPILINWEVISDPPTTVTISPWKDPLPLAGELKFFPQSSTEFVLTAKAGDKTVIKMISVGVQEAPQATAPMIEIFEVAPKELPEGGGRVEFSWSVSGQADRIRIVGKNGVIADNLKHQDFFTLNVSETSNFLLIATNGANLSASKDAKVTVAQAKKKVVLRVDRVEPGNDSLVQKLSVLDVYIKIGADNGSGVMVEPSSMQWPEITGTVKVTDQLNDCKIVVGETLHCIMTVNQFPNSVQTSGFAIATFTASYSGDSNYALVKSPDFPIRFNYQANTVTIAAVISPSASDTIPTVYSGNEFSLKVVVTPTNPDATRTVTGSLVATLTDGTTFSEGTLNTSPGNSLAGEVVFTGLKLPPAKMTADRDIQLLLNYKTNNTDYKNYATEYTIHVNKAVTQITTSTILTNAMFNDKAVVDFQVLVQPGKGQGPATGTVRVSDSQYSNSYCEGQLTDGKGTCTLLLNNLGARQFTFAYTSTADGLFADIPAAAEPSVDVVVGMASTTTIVTGVTRTNSNYDYEVGLMATVAYQVTSNNASNPHAPAGGTVQVSQSNSTTTCTGTLNAEGKGSCNILLNKAGNTTFTAKYVPDSNPQFYTTSSGSSSPITVLKAPTNITIKSFSQPSPVDFNSQLTVVYEVTAKRAESAIATPLDGTVTVVSNGLLTLCSNIPYPANTSCLTSALSQQGQNLIKATYNGGTDFEGSESTETEYTVRQGSTLALNAMPVSGSAYVDGPVEFSFVITPAGSAGTMSGTVAISASATEKCTNPITVSATPPAAASGKCTITFTTTGTRTVTAVFTPDAASAFGPASGDISYQVLPVTPAFAQFTITPPTPKVGQDATAAITLNYAPAVTAPTGTVDIVLNSTTLCTITLTSGSNGSGSCVLQFDTAGLQTITAQYSEGSSVSRFTEVSTSTSVTPVKADTTITLSIPANIVVGQTVTLTATLDAGKANPTGSVKFTIDNGVTTIVACTASISKSEADCSLFFPSAGNWSVRAEYIPNDASFSPSDTLSTATVISSTSRTTLTAVDSPSSIAYGGKVTFRATVAANPVGNVTPEGSVQFIFKLGGVEQPSPCAAQALITGVATCEYQFLQLGSWTVEAKFAGTADFATSTSTTPYSLSAVQSSSATTLAAVAPPASIVYGDTVTYRATVAPNPMTNQVPEGTVNFTFKLGGTVKGSCAKQLVSGAATCDFQYMEAGNNWSVEAKYVASTFYKESSAPSLSQTVGSRATMVTIDEGFTTPVKKPNPPDPATSTTFTVSVSYAPTIAGLTALEGTVNINLIGGTTILACTITLPANSCNYAPDKTVDTGDYSVQAVYKPPNSESRYTGSQSTALKKLTIN